MADGNETEFFEGFYGPSCEYAWFAEVSRDPSPEGLNGGRVKFLSVVKTEMLPVDEANISPDDIWFVQRSRDVQVARFKDGQLRCDNADEQTTEIVKDLQATFTDENRDFWENHFPPREEVRRVRTGRTGRSRDESDRER